VGHPKYEQPTFAQSGRTWGTTMPSGLATLDSGAQGIAREHIDQVIAVLGRAADVGDRLGRLDREFAGRSEVHQIGFLLLSQLVGHVIEHQNVIALAQIGIQLPHYSGYQQNLGVPVPMDELIPGDLVFKGYPTSYHVGLYAGGGSVIEAPHTGDVVRYDTIAGWMYAVRLR